MGKFTENLFFFINTPAQYTGGRRTR